MSEHDGDMVSESETALIIDTERNLVEELLAEYAQDRVRWSHAGASWHEAEAGWAVIDSAQMDGEYPRTTLEVRAHLSLDEAISVRVRLAVWDAESERPSRMPDSIPGVILINLMDWVRTESRVPPGAGPTGDAST